MAELRVQVDEGTRNAIFRVLEYIEDNDLRDYTELPPESNIEDFTHAAAMDLIAVASLLRRIDG